MREVEFNNLMSQLRALSAQAGGVGKPAAAPAANAPAFGKMLAGAIEQVNGQQVQAQKAAQDFELGRGDIASAMLAMQKAQVSFKAMTEVRNKLVQAYQDVMNMPV